VAYEARFVDALGDQVVVRRGLPLRSCGERDAMQILERAKAIGRETGIGI
jgi:hypothetical protein